MMKDPDFIFEARGNGRRIRTEIVQFPPVRRSIFMKGEIKAVRWPWMIFVFTVVGHRYRNFMRHRRFTYGVWASRKKIEDCTEPQKFIVPCSEPNMSRGWVCLGHVRPETLEDFVNAFWNTEFTKRRIAFPILNTTNEISLFDLVHSQLGIYQPKTIKLIHSVRSGPGKP